MITAHREAIIEATRTAMMPPAEGARARYAWWDDGKLIYIIEAIPAASTSVTNDAEAVIQDLVKRAQM